MTAKKPLALHEAVMLMMGGAVRPDGSRLRWAPKQKRISHERHQGKRESERRLRRIEAMATRSRYCEMCDEWMSQPECPKCGAPTVKAEREPDYEDAVDSGLPGDALTLERDR